MAASTAHIEEERAKRQKAKKKPQKKSSASYVARFVGGPFAYYGLLAAVAILLGLGTLMVVSASSGEAIINQVSQEAAKATEAGKMAGLANIKASVWGVGFKHIISIVLGIVVAWVISRMNYRAFKKFLPALGIGLLVLLIAVALFGYESNGAKRWIIIAGQSVQPSEFAKPILFLIMTFALYRVRELGNSHIFDINIMLMPAAITFICAAMIAAQPETGNLIILFVGICVAYLVLELPGKVLMRALGGLGAGVFLLCLITPYRAQRIMQYAGLAEKDADALWQVKQAQLAFGSGGFTGLGPGLSRQKYFYLPEAQNDFIIAIIGEELGLLGSFTVLAAFGLILYCGFKIAYQAKDSLGRALASGALAMIVVQAILNIFSVTGLGPVTGKPLPFVTLGGSSMITSFILLGILLSVARFGNQKEGRVVGAQDTVRSASRTRRAPAQGQAPVMGSAVKRGTKPSVKHEQANSHNSHKRTFTREAQRTRTRNIQKEDFDEDSLEWRWDSGSHLSGPRGRR